MLYPFQVYQTQVGEHNFWVAKSASLKRCVGQGGTSGEAISKLAQNEQEWIATAKEAGIPVPAVPVESTPDYKLGLDYCRST